MASTAFHLTFTYTMIGDHSLLVHFFGCKVDHWMLLDLAEISSETGKSSTEIIEQLKGE